MDKIALFLLTLFLPSLALAVPWQMSYQGVLTNSSGQAIKGPVELKIEIFDDNITATSIWSETHSSVPLTNGVYTIQLGSVSNTLYPELFLDDSRYMAVSVNGTTLSPRQKLTSTAFAYRSNFIDNGAVKAQSIGEVCDNGQALVYNSGFWQCGSVATGDITAVTTGTGLQGGSYSGEVALSLSQSYQLPQVCSSGQLAAWNATTSQWDCTTAVSSTGDITAVTAGAGLTGGGNTGDVSLDVNPDNVTLEINSDTLKVKNAGIGVNQLASSVAGNGLTGGSGTPLAVNVDSSSLEITTDQLKVKSGLYMKKYAKVAVVAQSGGDYTSPKLAMDNLSSWCGVASVSNPCLVKIMPGVYDLGTNYVTMAKYVDLEGSGRETTLLKSSGTVIIGASNAEIRNLSLQSSDIIINDSIISNLGVPSLYHVNLMCEGSSWHYGIRSSSTSPGSFTLFDVNLTMSEPNNDPSNCVGIEVENETADISIINSSIKGLCSGRNYALDINGNLTIRNSSIYAASSNYSYPLQVRAPTSAKTVKIFSSELEGAGTGFNSPISNSSSQTSFYVTQSQLAGGSLSLVPGTTIKCFGVYDENYTNTSLTTCP